MFPWGLPHRSYDIVEFLFQFYINFNIMAFLFQFYINIMARPRFAVLE